METTFKLAYGLTVAIMLVLVVILGTQTFYEGPGSATDVFYSEGEMDGDEQVDYHRNVFILTSGLGVVAVVGGLYLFRRVEAIPLGLILGGLGVVIYGWTQAADYFDRIGQAFLFVVVAVGLAIVLAAGYWFLGTRGASTSGRTEGGG